MKVLLLNGSPHEHGCTDTALKIVAETLNTHDIIPEIVWLGAGPQLDCMACFTCRRLKNNRCVFKDDIVNSLIEKAESADGFVFGSPVYYAHPSGRLLSVLDRVFFAGSRAFTGKPGAAIASARRAGTTATLDVINKYFTIAQMPVVSSSYWNMVHGTTPDEVMQDKEGLQTLRNLAHRMAELMQALAAAKAAGLPPLPTESGAHTNFIR